MLRALTIRCVTVLYSLLCNARLLSLVILRAAGAGRVINNTEIASRDPPVWTHLAPSRFA